MFGDHLEHSLARDPQTFCCFQDADRHIAIVPLPLSYDKRSGNGLERSLADFRQCMRCVTNFWCRSSTEVVALDLWVQEVDMGDVQNRSEVTKPRLCQRCGSRMPPQKRGRPRRWCSQQCRQSAYEKRHGLESWKDKQPKVSDLSDVIEESQSRAAKWDVAHRLAISGGPRPHAFGDCLATVCGDQLQLAMVIDTVTDHVLEDKILNNGEGRFLANRLMWLVDALGLLPAKPNEDRQWEWVPWQR